MGEGPTGGLARVALSSLLFVAAGVAQTVCMQAILYSGGGDRSTFLIAIPNYLGVAAVYFLGGRLFRALDQLGVRWSGLESSRVHTALYIPDNPPAPASKRLRGCFRRFFHPERRLLLVLAFSELCGFVSGLTGLSIAGSGLYQVVFSGVTVCTALLSTFFLRRRLTWLQWFFVAVITVGLMTTAEQVTHSTSERGTASLISGVLFILLSCFFYSSHFVISEWLLDPRLNAPRENSSASELPPPSGPDLSLYTGGLCFCLSVAYVLVHTVPRWDQLVRAPVRRRHGRAPRIVAQYALLCASAFLHATTHYDIVATVGAVPVGVLNALRAVSVFAASAALFCAHQTAQCYSPRKAAATALVVVAAAGYSLASARAKHPAPPPPPPPPPAPGTPTPQRPRKTAPLRRSRRPSKEPPADALPFLNDPSTPPPAAPTAGWLSFLFGARRKKEEPPSASEPDIV